MHMLILLQSVCCLSEEVLAIYDGNVVMLCMVFPYQSKVILDSTCDLFKVTPV